MPDDVVDMIMADHRDVERFVRPLETQPDQRARKFEPDSYNGARMRSGDAEGARALDRRSGFGWTGGWVAAQLPSEVQRAGQTGHEEHKLYRSGSARVFYLLDDGASVARRRGLLAAT